MNTSRRARLKLPVICTLLAPPTWASGPATLVFDPPESASTPTAPTTRAAAPATAAPATAPPVKTSEKAAAPPVPSVSAPNSGGSSGNSSTAVSPRADAAGRLVSPGSTIAWRSPSHCPAPQARLDALLGPPAKHPLWGQIEISETPPAWTARLRLSDAPSTPTSRGERVIEGNTCSEVTEAALLVLSIMQREAEAPPELPPVPASVEPVILQPASTPPPTKPLNDARTKPQSTAKPPSKASRRDDETPSTATSLGLGASWTLWNGKTPAIGAVAVAQHAWGPVSVRPQVGLSTFVNALPTTETAKVSLTSTEAGVDLCLDLVSGVAGCAGPTLQYLVVEGEDVGTPTRSGAWFPGVSASLVGHHDSAGLGLWGELGANLRFKEIVLELNPVGEVAGITRLGFYAWIGPQWRWR